MYLLDHIVHFVKEPKQLVEETKKIGLHTVQGGKHEMWGTYNSLSYFGLSYIEFIAIFDQDLYKAAANKPFTLHESYKKRQMKNGLTRIAMRTTTIEDDAIRLQASGFTVYGPDTFSRTRPDGSVLSWKLLHFGHQNLRFDFPFLIQWEESDDERYSDLVSRGVIGEHPLGDLKIEEISIAVEDLEVAKNWAQVFNFDIEYVESTIKVIAPNCTFIFNAKKSLNEIEQVVISHSKVEKVIEIDGGHYKFKA